MTPLFESLVDVLKRLPGLGYRSAERVALHLLIERPEAAGQLQEALCRASEGLGRCPRCGNLSENDLCEICQDPSRRTDQLCVLETVPDLLAFERSGMYRGVYHVLHGKLSPLNHIGPEQLNLGNLPDRLREERPSEVILALSNDVEGEATCRYLQDIFLAEYPELKVTRIGFGLPSGGNVVYADATTLRSALDARRQYQ